MNLEKVERIREMLKQWQRAEYRNKRKGYEDLRELEKEDRFAVENAMIPDSMSADRIWKEIQKEIMTCTVVELERIPNTQDLERDLRAAIRRALGWQR